MDLVSAYVVVTPPPGGSDTTAPTVTMTSPADGETVSGNVPVAANASDNFGVSKVDFYRDGGTPIGTDTSAPYAITWDSSTVSPGPHTLHAVATDGAGNTGTSAWVGITVEAPAAPQVAITSPTNGTVLRRSTVPVVLEVTPGINAVSRVDVLVNSSVICSPTTSPYDCSWQVPAPPNKTYELKANAYDTSGLVGVSNTVTVTSSR
jgi:hypothetical protein